MEATDIKSTGLMIRSVDDLSRIGKMMSASGYFQDAREAAQAAVKVQAGMEMGFGPFASMTGIHIIQGRPSVGANLMASAVKSNPKYDYRVREMTAEVCRIEFFERVDGKRESIGISEFTIAEARKAGTKNLDKFPKNMLFARAMSNGIRWYCPDVFAGNPTYTPEELGAEVDEDGNIMQTEPVPQVAPAAIEAEVVPAEAPAEPKPGFDTVTFLLGWQRSEDLPKMSIEEASAVKNSAGIEYGKLETEKLFHMMNRLTKSVKSESDPEKWNQMMTKLGAINENMTAKAAAQAHLDK